MRKTSMIRIKRTLRILCFAVALIAITCFFCRAEGETSTNELLSANIGKNKDNIVIVAALTNEYVRENKGGMLYLFEIEPYQKVSEINSLTPIATAIVNSQSVTYDVSLYSEGRSRLYSKFIIAEKLTGGTYSVITGAHYIDNPEILAERTYEMPAPSTKKGLEVQLMSDAQQLAIGHTVVHVAINEFLLAEKTVHSESFVYNNTTYYVDSNMLEMLDNKIRVFSESGIRVYMDLVLTAPSEAMNSKLKSLYYDSSYTEAEFYAINVWNKNAVRYLEGFVGFLAERYTREDKAYGFCGNYILGYEINSNRYYNYAGPMKLDTYLNYYTIALRIVDTAVRSVYSNGKVYVSVANNFNSITASLTESGDSYYDYPAKDLLDKLNSQLRYAGNIPWNLAINPYPSDITKMEYWEDANATQSFSTKFITMNNIGVITDYMCQDEFLYQGETRSIIISEFGIHAASNVENAETIQAAAYALAYFTADSNPYIDAFIYHRHVDNSNEMGLHFGLWSNVEGSVASPLAKREIYNVLKKIDTSESQSITEKYLSVIGITAWGNKIDGYVPRENAAYSEIQTIPILKSDLSGEYTGKLLYDFTQGEKNGFMEMENAEYTEFRTDAELEKSVFYAQLNPVSGVEYMGIGRTFSPAVSFEKIDYLGFSIKAGAPETVSTMSILLRLTGTDSNGNTVIYEGLAQVKPNTWNELTFKISEFNQKCPTGIETLKIWTKSFDDVSYEGEFSLSLQNMTAYQNKGGMSFWWILLIVFISLVVLVLLILVVLIIRKKSIEKHRRAAQRGNLNQMSWQGGYPQGMNGNMPPYGGRHLRNPNSPPDRNVYSDLNNRFGQNNGYFENRMNNDFYRNGQNPYMRPVRRPSSQAPMKKDDGFVHPKSVYNVKPIEKGEDHLGSQTSYRPDRKFNYEKYNRAQQKTDLSNHASKGKPTQPTFAQDKSSNTRKSKFTPYDIPIDDDIFGND